MVSRSALRWTVVEDETLRRECERQSAKAARDSIDWTAVAERLPNRSNKDCRKRWTNNVVGGLRKGSWEPAEDAALRRGVEQNGLSWSRVAQRVKTRSPDQCAKRWSHQLDPNLDHSDWTREEADKLLRVVVAHGRQWLLLKERYFPRRSTNNIKNQYTIMTNKKTRNVDGDEQPVSAATTAPSGQLDSNVDVNGTGTPQPPVLASLLHDKAALDDSHLCSLDPDQMSNGTFGVWAATKEPSNNAVAPCSPSGSHVYVSMDMQNPTFPDFLDPELYSAGTENILAGEMLQASDHGGQTISWANLQAKPSFDPPISSTSARDQSPPTSIEPLANAQACQTDSLLDMCNFSFPATPMDDTLFPPPSRASQHAVSPTVFLPPSHTENQGSLSQQPGKQSNGPSLRLMVHRPSGQVISDLMSVLVNHGQHASVHLENGDM